MSRLQRRAVSAGGTAALGGVVAGIAAAAIDGPLAWLVLAVVAMVAGAAVLFLAFRSTDVSLRDTAEAARQLRLQGLYSRATATSGVTAELTYEFNAMATHVEAVVQEIGAEHARLEAALAAAADAIVAVDADTAVQYANPAALAALDAEAASVVGRPLIESARDYELDAIIREALAAQAMAGPRMITFGADRIPLQVAAVPVPEGGAWAALLVMVDLTEFHRVDRVRRDFVTNVSHELRTPIASLGALVDTLELGDLSDEDEREFLSQMRGQVERLTRLTNELLDLSRIESGAIHLDPEAIDLGIAAREAVATMSPALEEANVRVACPEGPLPAVEADHNATLRILTNLLDNALKFSPPGGTITVSVVDEGPLVALEVCDDGPGLAEPDLARVFERFFKAERSRATKGAGLGLAIVKHLARAHGGTVAARNEPGRGAAFTVRLPKVFVGRQEAIEAIAEPPVRRSA